MRWLSRVSYYRFSAHLYTNRLAGSDNYKPGTTFAEIANLYNFDRQLRLVLMNGIECIEVWLRTVVTYELAHRCGPSGYLKKPSFNQGFDHKQFRKTLRQEHERSEVKAGFRPALSEQVHRREPLPVWMATEVLTFGTLSVLYSVLPLNSKRSIAATVGLQDNVLSNWLQSVAYIRSNWLQSVAYIRNLCAHHSRVWNRKLAISPKILRGSDSHGIEPSKLYAALLALDFLISQNRA